MWVLGRIVLLVAVLGCHARDLKQFEDFQATTNKLELLVEKLERDNAEMKVEFERLRNTTLLATTPACFSAVKTTSQAVVSGDTILFNEELIDTHDTFNTIFGIYIIPQKGIWEVTVTLFKYPSTSSAYNSNYGDLYLGDATLLTRIYHRFSTDTGASTHSTSSIIREFEAMDSISVKSASTGTFYGDTTYKASQFSAKYLGEHPYPPKH